MILPGNSKVLRNTVFSCDMNSFFGDGGYELPKVVSKFVYVGGASAHYSREGSIAFIRLIKGSMFIVVVIF